MSKAPIVIAILATVMMANYYTLNDVAATNYNDQARKRYKLRYAGMDNELYNEITGEKGSNNSSNRQNTYNGNQKLDVSKIRTISKESAIAAARQRKLGRYGTNASYSGSISTLFDQRMYEEIDDSAIFNVKLPYTGHYKVGNPYEIMGQKYYPRKDENYSEVGVSSWYGDDFYGKKTANGEIYDMYDLTAAHRTLPLPSIVRVTNLENGKSIRLRVNDRGPFAKNRIIDVSKVAAGKLGFHEQGTTRVKVEYLKDDTDKLLKILNLR